MAAPVAEPASTGPERSAVVGAQLGKAVAAEPGCLFCHPGNPEMNAVAGGTVYARWDNFPAAPGHLEIVPFRHVLSFFDLTDQEARDLHYLARTMRSRLEQLFRPDGYTLGVNDGTAAGRSVPHLHIIPRFYGDVPDPRGGIRRIMPDCEPDAWR
ncbi:diadenosine tetraphosphate (Ap4A) HIT family hydrolase [Nocardia sp. GAS34]|uniref:HIT family protein n=1 Tax=unclassified Nocardia TaxID=2637762 RepID=UPI003D21DE89